MISKLLTIVFVTLILAKYVFDIKIHEKYIFGVAAVLAVASNFDKKHSAIEMFDGSSVAFDKEAFENLNRIVNEIAGDGRLTVPGNLVVQGTTELQGTTEIQDKLTCKNTVYLDKNLHSKQTIYSETMIPNYIKTSTSTQKWEGGNTKTLEIQCPVLLKKTLNVDGTSTFKNDCTLDKNLTVQNATVKNDFFCKHLIPNVIKSSTTLGTYTSGNTKTVEIQCPLNTNKTIQKNRKETITHDDTLYFLNTQQHTNNNRDDCGKTANNYLRFEHGGNSDGCEALGMFGTGKAIIQVKKV